MPPATMPRSGDRPAPAPVTPPELLRVHVAGEVAVDGVERAALGSRKARVLLRELALCRGRPVSVDALCDVLWGDDLPVDPPAQLAVIASRLRRVLGTDRVTFGDGGYALRYDWLDVEAAEALVDSAARRCDEQAFTGALSAARSAMDLLARQAAGDADQRIDRIAARARHQYARALLACGDPATAFDAARDALDRDGYDEEALRLAMAALGAMGQTPAALQLHEQFRARLGDELGADPSPATAAVHRAVLRQEEIPGIVVRGDRAIRTRHAVTLVGRDDEVRVLDDALDTASRRLTRVSVEGEPGIGKTFLVTSWLEARGPQVVRLRARCDDSTALLPLQPVLDALHGHLRDAGATAADALLGPDRPVLAPVFGSAVAGPVPEVQTAMGAATTVAGEAMLYAALASLMSRVCTGPTVLFIDGAEHADQATVAWLKLLVHRAPELPLAVILTQRSGAQRIAADVVVTLHPLSLDEAEVLVGSGRAAALHARSGGNPLYLTELAASTNVTAVPSTLRDSINARCDAAPQVATTLRAAAVLGSTVDAGLLASVLRADPIGVIDDLEQGARLAFLDERDTGFAFRHSIVRDALAGSAGALRRAWLHREAARLLVERADADPMQLAEHARLSGERETAAVALARASAIAAGRFDLAMARTLVDEGLAQRETTQGLLQRARINLAQARYHEAEADAEAAVERGDDIAALEVAGAVAYYRRRFEHSRALGDSLVRRSDDHTPQLAGLIIGARAAHAAGDLHEAAALIERADDVARRASLPPPSAVHAFLEVHRGDAAGALRVLAESDSAIDTRSTAYTPVHRHFVGGYALATCGRAAEALERWERGAVEAERFGLVRYLNLCNNMQSWVLRGIGELAHARERNLEGRAGGHAADYRELEGYAILDLCETAMLSGDRDGASRLLNDARAFTQDDYAYRWRHTLRIDLLAARLEFAAERYETAHHAALQLSERAAAIGALRYEVLAGMLASEAAAAAGEPVAAADVLALCRRVPNVAGPDAWLLIAGCAAATGVEACHRLAVDVTATLERALPTPLRPGFRRYAGARLERMSTAGRSG